MTLMSRVFHVGEVVDNQDKKLMIGQTVLYLVG